MPESRRKSRERIVSALTRIAAGMFQHVAELNA